MPLDPKMQQAFREIASTIEGIDTEVYEKYQKDPLDPIIGLGRKDAPVGFFGRDPGRDEVKYGEPFIGAGGQIARKVIYEHLHGKPMPDFDAGRSLSQEFFWANTVPYKPIGNKAWSEKIKKRFHPLMRQLLIEQWHGRTIITFGREAFLWFAIDQPKEEKQRLEAFWKSEDRFTNHTEVTLTAEEGKGHVFTLYPLPHPSPLNQAWFDKFPDLLNKRLRNLFKK